MTAVTPMSGIVSSDSGGSGESGDGGDNDDSGDNGQVMAVTVARGAQKKEAPPSTCES